MKDPKEITACVCDHGLFLELARRLAREYQKVYYWTPWEKGFPLINDCVIGDGFSDIERVEDFWPLLNDIDLFVFPDIQHSGLQLHLESLGKAVWGSRDADSIELQRVKFLHALPLLGLPPIQYQVVRGLSNLRKMLQREEDKFIKLSRYRGSMETWHHVNYKLSEPMLDVLAVRFGAVKEVVPFVVCDPIETDIEVGYDGYSVDGDFPEFAIQGYEAKDKAFLASVHRYSDLPKEITVVNENFSGLLRNYRYRNFFSTEIRVKDGESYFIDPCMRCPSPATEAQLELYENLGEIIWNGANGIIIDQKITAPFAAEAVIKIKVDKTSWATVEVPEKASRWVKMGSCCNIEGLRAFPPSPSQEEEIGWVIGLGETIQEAIDHLKENAEAIRDDRLEIRTDSLVDLLKEIETAESHGIEFTEQQVPKPESVIQDA